MSFPKKFKELIETTINKVDKPDRVLLTYCVCTCTVDACGWGGWLLEDVVAIDASGKKKLSLPFDDNQKCPICGKITFRTNAQIAFVPGSKKEKDKVWPPIENVEYSEIEYD